MPNNRLTRQERKTLEIIERRTIPQPVLGKHEDVLIIDRLVERGLATLVAGELSQCSWEITERGLDALRC